MAGSRDIRAGRAYVELNTKDRISAGLRSIGRKFVGFASFVGKASLAIGTAALSGSVVALKAFSDMGSEMKDLAARTGMSVEGLSELKFAAEQSGASMDDVVTATKTMQKTIAAAAGGSKEAADALGELGLSAGDLQQLSPDEQFRKISKAIAGIEDPAARAGAALKVFGKGGTVLLPMAQELDALTKRARELGIVMSTDDANAADKFGDTIGELWSVIKRGVFLIGGALQPAAQALVDALVRGASSLNQLLQQNRGSITAWAQSIGQAAVWVGTKFAELGKAADDALGGALTALGSGEFKIAGQLAAVQFQEAWLGLKDWWINLWDDIFANLQAFSIRAAAAVEKVWTETAGKIRNLWSTFIDQNAIDVQTRLIDARQDLLHKAAQRGDTGEVSRLQKLIDEGRKKRNELMGAFGKNRESEDLQKRLDAIEKEKKAQLDALNDIHKKRSVLEQQELGEKVADLEKQGQELRDRLAKTNEDKRRASAVDAGLEDFFGSGNTKPIIDVDEIGDAVEKASKNAVEARGTFNAAALQSLQGGKDDEIAKYTKETAVNTKRLANGFTFVYQA